MYQLYFNEKIKIKKDLDQKKRISCIVKKKRTKAKTERNKRADGRGECFSTDFLRFCNEIKCHDPHRTASYIKSESLGKNSQNYFWEGGAKVV